MKRTISILSISLLFIYSCITTDNKSNAEDTEAHLDTNNLTEQLDYGKKLLDEDKYLEAKIILSRLIRQNPPTAVLYEYRAMAFSYLAKHDSAIADMDTAIHLHNNISSIYHRGQIKYSANLFKDAIADFDTVISKKPDFDDAYIGKGVALLKLDKKNEACNCFATALGYHNKDAKTLIDENCP